jgi:hypothetical protein
MKSDSVDYILLLFEVIFFIVDYGDPSSVCGLEFLDVACIESEVRPPCWPWKWVELQAAPSRGLQGR